MAEFHRKIAHLVRTRKAKKAEYDQQWAKQYDDILDLFQTAIDGIESELPEPEEHLPSSPVRPVTRQLLLEPKPCLEPISQS